MIAPAVGQILATVKRPSVEGRAGFIAWLKLAHGIIRATERLLAIAEAKSEGHLCEFYAKKIIEEADHANWLAVDLLTIGEKPPLLDHAAACIAGAQYYYLEHVGPEIFLGYIAALEFNPMPIEDVEKLGHLYGQRAVRTLKHHAIHDVEHSLALSHILNEQTEHASEICYNAFLTARTYAHYLRERIAHAIV